MKLELHDIINPQREERFDPRTVTKIRQLSLSTDCSNTIELTNQICKLLAEGKAA